MAKKRSIVMWSVPNSLYSGKLRSCLLKKGLPFHELVPARPRFVAEIAPAAGHYVVPIIETADGEKRGVLVCVGDHSSLAGRSRRISMS